MTQFLVTHWLQFLAQVIYGVVLFVGVMAMPWLIAYLFIEGLKCIERWVNGEGEH